VWVDVPVDTFEPLRVLGTSSDPSLLGMPSWRALDGAARVPAVPEGDELAALACSLGAFNAYEIEGRMRPLAGSPALRTALVAARCWVDALHFAPPAGWMMVLKSSWVSVVRVMPASTRTRPLLDGCAAGMRSAGASVLGVSALPCGIGAVAASCLVAVGKAALAWPALSLKSRRASGLHREPAQLHHAMQCNAHPW
jgi:hypothetical protein